MQLCLVSLLPTAVSSVDYCASVLSYGLRCDALYMRSDKMPVLSGTLLTEIELLVLVETIEIFE